MAEVKGLGAGKVRGWRSNGVHVVVVRTGSYSEEGQTGPDLGVNKPAWLLWEGEAGGRRQLAIVLVSKSHMK